MSRRKRCMVILLVSLGIVLALSGCVFREINNYFWCTNLVHAIEKNDMEEIEEILSEPGMNINKEGNVVLQFFFGSECSPSTPFEAAVLSNNLDIMQSVLSYEDIVPFSDEFNPVCWVIYSTNDGTWQERHEIVRLMFEKGLDPDYVSESGESTLCGIAGESVLSDETNCYDSERAQAILNLYQFVLEQSKIKRQKDTIDGATSIHSAVASSNILLLEYLLEELQYSINETTVEGETPLVYFAKYRLPYEDVGLEIEPLVKYCKEQGADLSIADVTGKTAYDYAVECSNTKVANLLKPAV